MSKNFTIAETKNGKATITQNAYVHFCTLDAMRKAVDGVDGKIAKTTDGMFKATVASVKIAETCVRKVERGLANARKNKAKNDKTEVKNTKTEKATSRVTKSAPAPAKGKAPKTVVIDGVKYVRADEEKSVPTVSTRAKKNAPKGAKGGKKVEPKVVKKPLTKAEKKAIRSECMKQANGDRAKYDKLCKARGVDNGR